MEEDEDPGEFVCGPDRLGSPELSRRSWQLGSADETELYEAMDWLLPRQARLEQQLAQRHFSNGGPVLTM